MENEQKKFISGSNCPWGFCTESCLDASMVRQAIADYLKNKEKLEELKAIVTSSTCDNTKAVAARSEAQQYI